MMLDAARLFVIFLFLEGEWSDAFNSHCQRYLTSVILQYRRRATKSRADSHGSTNMHKLYQTCEEQTDPIDGNISGDIPEWVTGSLYRNGPGMYEVGEHKYKHLFDSLALFQRFHIANKKVTYQSRYLQSDAYKKNMTAKRIAAPSFGSLTIPDPCLNIFQRFLTHFQHEEPMPDNTNVSFFPLQDELYAATETKFIHRVDPDTLESIGKVDLTDYVSVSSVTAHPHWDADGTLHNIGNSYQGRPKICIVKIPPKQDESEVFPKGEVISSSVSAGIMSIPYLHSFAMTENYYIYVEQPLFINVTKLITAKLRGLTFKDAIEWWPSIKTRFRIINKSTGDEVNKHIKYQTDALMTFHHINAYEENGHIVLDLCAYKDDPLPSLYLHELTSEEYEKAWSKLGDPEPRRFVLPLDVSKIHTNENLITLPNTTATAERKNDTIVYCTWEMLADTGFEFPQINYSGYNGRKYRYAYGVGLNNTGHVFRTLTKIDTETKTFTEWSADKCYPSEPVFVANPDAASEDDGVLLSAVNRSEFDDGNNAFLLVLDAKSMKEVARAEFDITRFPVDFHGIFKYSKFTRFTALNFIIFTCLYLNSNIRILRTIYIQRTFRTIGVLISAENRSDYDGTKHAFLLLLDTQSITEVARAEFNIERFPRDTHGIFRPDC